MKNTKVYLCIGNEMFEGTTKLNGSPKHDDKFVAAGTTFTCKNPEPIIAELSFAVYPQSQADARHRLIDSNFMQVDDAERRELIRQHAPELELVESTEH
jgi:hypothetical protein